MATEKTRHVVLRLRQDVRHDGKRCNIVDLHNQVVEQYGRVAVAKFGRIPSAERTRPIVDQLARGFDNRLFLLFKDAGNFSAVSAKLSQITNDHVDDHWIPGYYDAVTLGEDFIDSSLVTWFVVQEKFRPSKIDSLCLEASGRPLREVVEECRTAVLFVG